MGTIIFITLCLGTQGHKYIIIYSFIIDYTDCNRMLSQKTPRHMVRCLYQLYSVATRWQYQLQLATTNIGLSTCPSPTFTTMYAEHIVMVLYYSVSFPFLKVCFYLNFIYKYFLSYRYQGRHEGQRISPLSLPNLPFVYCAYPPVPQACLEVVWCPDSHYHCAIYSPYIGDYPKQCLLSCIIQGWYAK